MTTDEEKANVEIWADDNIGHGYILIDLRVKPQDEEEPPFDEYITVGRNTILEIRITNISGSEIDNLKTKIYIDCPNNVVRKCFLEITELEKNETLNKTFGNFFIPEVPGSHLLSVAHESPHRFISSPGLAGSKFRITSLEQLFLPFSFDVYSENDLITLRKLDKQERTSSIMLWVTIGLIVITLIASWDELKTAFYTLADLMNWIKCILNW